MIDSTLVTVITGTGVTGVFCILFLLGLIYPRSVVEDLRAERDALRQTVSSERDRADAAVQAAQGTRDILSALQAGMTIAARQQAEQQGLPP